MNTRDGFLAPVGVDDQRSLGGTKRSSVANLTRKDAEDFLALAPRLPVKTRAIPYLLAKANEALADLRRGLIEGAAVLVPFVSEVGSREA